MAFKTLVRQRRRDRGPVISPLSGDQRMIRFARTGFTLSDTVSPERSDLHPVTLLTGMFALSCVPLVVLFFT